MVLTLDWLALGSPAKVPSGYKLGASPDDHQKRELAYLFEELSCWSSEESRSVADLGRAQEKFQQSSSLLSNLAALTAEFHNHFKLYEDYKVPQKSASPSRHVRDPLTTRVGSTASAVEGAHPVVASRLKVTDEPSFNADSVLTGLHREIMQDPSVARADPPHPSPPRVEVKASVSELVKLLEKFDDSGRLLLIPAGHPKLPPLAERVGLFTVFNESSADRLIVDARPANIRENPLTYWVQHLGAPACLVDLTLESDEVLMIYSSDIVDFYNRFVVGEARSFRNTLAKSVPARMVKHLKACPAVPSSARLVPVFKVLAMGDVQAVELAQAAHMLLCAAAGAITDTALISRLWPLPRGPYLAGLCIDDFGAFEVEKGLLGATVACGPRSCRRRLLSVLLC